MVSQDGAVVTGEDAGQVEALADPLALDRALLDAATIAGD